MSISSHSSVSTNKGSGHKSSVLKPETDGTAASASVSSWLNLASAAEQTNYVLDGNIMNAAAVTSTKTQRDNDFRPQTQHQQQEQQQHMLTQAVSDYDAMQISKYELDIFLSKQDIIVSGFIHQNVFSTTDSNSSSSSYHHQHFHFPDVIIHECLKFYQNNVNIYLFRTHSKNMELQRQPKSSRTRPRQQSLDYFNIGLGLEANPLTINIHKQNRGPECVLNKFDFLIGTIPNLSFINKRKFEKHSSLFSDLNFDKYSTFSGIIQGSKQEMQIENNSNNSGHNHMNNNNQNSLFSLLFFPNVMEKFHFFKQQTFDAIEIPLHYKLNQHRFVADDGKSEPDSSVSVFQLDFRNVSNVIASQNESNTCVCTMNGHLCKLQLDVNPNSNPSRPVSVHNNDIIAGIRDIDVDSADVDLSRSRSNLNLNLSVSPMRIMATAAAGSSGAHYDINNVADMWNEFSNKSAGDKDTLFNGSGVSIVQIADSNRYFACDAYCCMLLDGDTSLQNRSTLICSKHSGDHPRNRALLRDFAGLYYEDNHENVFVCGGHSRSFRECDIWNVTKNVRTSMPSLSRSHMERPIVFGINKHVICVAGNYTSNVGTVEYFDFRLANKKWLTAPNQMQLSLLDLPAFGKRQIRRIFV